MSSLLDPNAVRQPYPHTLQISRHKLVARKIIPSLPAHQLAMRRWPTTTRAGIAAFATATGLATIVYAVGFRLGGVRGGEHPQCRSMFLA